MTSEVRNIWRRGGYSTVSDQTIKKRILALFDEYSNLRKNSKLEKITQKIENCFDIGCSNLEEVIMKDRKRTDADKSEDIAFLKDQFDKRAMSMSVKDIRYQEKVDSMLKRKEREKARILKSKEKDKENEQENGYESLSDDESLDDRDEAFVVRDRKKRRPDFVTITLPTKTLADITADVCKASSISFRATTSVLAKVISSGGGNLDDFTLSKSSIHSKTNVKVKESAKNIRIEQKSKLSGRALTLHFDGKLVRDFTNGKIANRERCAILVSSPELERDELIGIPVVGSSRGQDQIDGLLPLLDEFDIKTNIFSVCSDSTASQTGKYSGAITLLQRELPQPVVWLICRRHVMELHAKHALEVILGTSTAPHEQLFKRLKLGWNELSPAIQLSLMNGTYVKFDFKSLCGTFLYDLAIEVKQYCAHALATNTFPRGDYRELCELVYLFLGGSINGLTIKQPGAFHYARFMGRGLYFLKLAIFQTSINFLDNDDMVNINRAITFIALFYCKWFLMSSLAVKAPSEDLKSLNQMEKYEEVDGEVARAVIKSVKRHGWYLSQELCTFSLVDEDLDDQVRSKIAQRLLENPKPAQYNIGFPEIPDLSKIEDVSDLIGPLSWYLIDVANLQDVDWLHAAVYDWYKYSSYQKLKQFLSHIAVVNDAAERGVKLIQDYVDSCHNEELRQDLITLVKAHKVKNNAKTTKQELKNL